MVEVPVQVAPVPDHVPDWPPGDIEPPALALRSSCPLMVARLASWALMVAAVICLPSLYRVK
jgi:hypothetical protein